MGPKIRRAYTMPRVAIQLPGIEAKDKVEVEVTANGTRHRHSYRIEVFSWLEYAQPGEDRVTCLKRFIQNYDRTWQLVQIGEATNSEISVLFEQHHGTRSGDAT